MSTSDVHKHANAHKRREAIESKGFARFRAGDDCGVPACPFGFASSVSTTPAGSICSSSSFCRSFSGEQSSGEIAAAPRPQSSQTHFHCRRAACGFVFRHKAEIGAITVKHTVIPHNSAFVFYAVLRRLLSIMIIRA